MFATIRRLMLCVAICSVFGVAVPMAAVRADEDYTTFWQDANSPSPPASQDYNTYWQEVQAQQAGQR
jgi:hypothetical protein